MSEETRVRHVTSCHRCGMRIEYLDEKDLPDPLLCSACQLEIRVQNLSDGLEKTDRRIHDQDCWQNKILMRLDDLVGDIQDIRNRLDLAEAANRDHFINTGEFSKRLDALEDVQDTWFTKHERRLNRDDVRIDLLKENVRKIERNIATLEPSDPPFWTPETTPPEPSQLIETTGKSEEGVRKIVSDFAEVYHSSGPPEQPEPDEEGLKAIYRECDVRARNEGIARAVAKLVVQERASRESWAERARLMEDERNKERKRADGWEADALRYSKNSEFHYGRWKMACSDLAEARNERDRCTEAFEELVGSIYGNCVPMTDEFTLVTGIDRKWLDALEKKARWNDE